MKPTTSDTAYLGGIESSMCTWSGIRWPSKTRLSFCSAKRRNTSPKCCRSPSYSTLRRHLGMNDTWYLHSHTEWLKLSNWSIRLLLDVCFGRLTSGVSWMDSRKCQTATATPAEPGDLLTLSYVNIPRQSRGLYGVSRSKRLERGR